MEYYVIRTAPRREERSLTLARRALEDLGIRLIYLTRTIFIRRGGKRIRTEAPLFPGYLFLETPHLDLEICRRLQREGRYLWFLKFDDEFARLTGADLEILKRFLQFGESIPPSLAYFDENDRIRIVKGALAGMEGHIIKVDRRKQRARIKIEFRGKEFQIDLAFEVLEKAPT